VPMRLANRIRRGELAAGPTWDGENTGETFAKIDMLLRN
jgi:hypothetical protein